MFRLKNASYRDLVRRQKYERSELRRMLAQALIANTSVKSHTKIYFMKKILWRATRIRNRCLVTNKSRTVFKHFNLSRMPFKMLASTGMLSGVRLGNN